VDTIFPGLWGLTPIGFGIGVVALLYFLLATGRLITKSSHEREIAIYRGILANKDKTIDALTAQVASLMSVGRTVQAVLRSAGPDVDEDTDPFEGSTG
jgi:hypothetical protein